MNLLNSEKKFRKNVKTKTRRPFTQPIPFNLWSSFTGGSMDEEKPRRKKTAPFGSQILGSWFSVASASSADCCEEFYEQPVPVPLSSFSNHAPLAARQNFKKSFSFTAKDKVSLRSWKRQSWRFGRLCKGLGSFYSEAELNCMTDDMETIREINVGNINLNDSSEYLNDQDRAQRRATIVNMAQSRQVDSEVHSQSPPVASDVLKHNPSIRKQSLPYSSFSSSSNLGSPLPSGHWNHVQHLVPQQQIAVASGAVRSTSSTTLYRSEHSNTSSGGGGSPLEHIQRRSSDTPRCTSCSPLQQLSRNSSNSVFDAMDASSRLTIDLTQSCATVSSEDTPTSPCKSLLCVPNQKRRSHSVELSRSPPIRRRSLVDSLFLRRPSWHSQHSSPVLGKATTSECIHCYLLEERRLLTNSGSESCSDTSPAFDQLMLSDTGDALMNNLSSFLRPGSVSFSLDDSEATTSRVTMLNNGVNASFLAAAQDIPLINVSEYDDTTGYRSPNGRCVNASLADHVAALFPSASPDRNSGAESKTPFRLLGVPRTSRSSSIDVPFFQHQQSTQGGSGGGFSKSPSFTTQACDPRNNNHGVKGGRSTRSKSLDVTRFERLANSAMTTATTRAVGLSPTSAASSARRNAESDLISPMTVDRTRYWTDIVQPDEHIWTETASSGDCYINESDCVKSGERCRCVACNIIIHEGCLIKLDYRCKPTFRQDFTKFQKELPYVPTLHHWTHSKRLLGKCGRCQKSFQQKLFNKDVVGLICSWCKTAYHNKRTCFTHDLLEEECTFGDLKHAIVPSSWVFKLPPRKVSTVRKRTNPGASALQRRKKRSRKERVFVVKPPIDSALSNMPNCPVLVFVNPKSGGSKGTKLLNTLCWYLNPRQVFDITAFSGPRYGLEMFRKVPNLRLLVCGGDGTIGWVLSTLDQLRWPAFPPIATIPLGTGNDLANTLGWGKTFGDEPLASILMAVMEECSVVQLDRWLINVAPNTAATDVEETTSTEEAVAAQLPLSVMNNYFSIGADAGVALRFHESRAANPENFSSRFKNRMYYGTMGTKDLFQRSWKELSEFITLECDGRDMTPRIQELKPHCLIFLNIPRYGGGTLPWGCSSQGSSEFQAPSFSDGKIEILGFTSATLAALQVESALQFERHGEPLAQRIAQCSTCRLVTKKAIPAQVDGEPTRLAPSVIEISCHCKVPMLQRLSLRPNRKYSTVPQMDSDPSSVGHASPRHTASAAISFKLTVARVAKQDYETYCSSFNRLLDCSQPLGDLTLDSEMYLDHMRSAVQELFNGGETTKLPNDWCFLDCTGNDRAFRIDHAQESLCSLMDIYKPDSSFLLLMDAHLPSFADRNSNKQQEHCDGSASNDEYIRIIIENNCPEVVL